MTQIYTSPLPDVPIPDCSIFTHLFSSDPRSTGQYSSIPESAPAFIDATSGTTLSRGHLKHLALSFGHGLRHYPRLSLKRGDTIMIYSPNSLAWPVILFGTIAAGLRATLANSAYTAQELEHQFHDSGAKLVLTSEEGLSVVEEMMKKRHPGDVYNRIIVINTSLKWAGGRDSASPKPRKEVSTLEDLLQKGTLSDEERFDGDLAHETAFLCYSSGTTGKPKGVETTHKNIAALVELVHHAFGPTQASDAMLGILPFYHIYGAAKLLHFPFRRGLPVVIQTRFEPVQFCQNIERYRISYALVVPPVLVVMTAHPAMEKYNLSSLKVLYSGAAPLGEPLVKSVTERLLSFRKGIANANDIEILQGYGLTETSPTSHLLQSGDSIRKIGSVGILLPNLETRLVKDVEDGGENVDAEEGQPGELWIRGPTIMKGYLNNSEATRNSITPDGFFKTGDIAVRDKDGYYYIVDRKKELIKYKGFQVPPAELESILLSHPDIADAAVIGVNSPKEATELPRAYVVPSDISQIQSPYQQEEFGKAVAKWIEGKVARHKMLRGGVVVVDIIPKSAAGKILRRELRERARREVEGSQLKARL